MTASAAMSLTQQLSEDKGWMYRVVMVGPSWAESLDAE